MLEVVNNASPSILDNITSIARDLVSEEELENLIYFIEQYFRHVDPADLARLAPVNLVKAALSHLAFAQQFTYHIPKIRVFNPTLEEHGWESEFTIIEIINNDMPFLVDSVIMEINRQGYTQHLTIHPVLNVQRDNNGNFNALKLVEDDFSFESFLHIEIDRQENEIKLKQLGDGILSVLKKVQHASQDRDAMFERINEAIQNLNNARNRFPQNEIQEDIDFLHWLCQANFTFLGAKSYSTNTSLNKLEPLTQSGLGIAREHDKDISSIFDTLEENASSEMSKKPIVLMKATCKSDIHRPGYLDYISIKRFDESGNVIGEHRVVGLYDASAYNTNPSTIPIVRKKISWVMDRAGLRKGGHLSKNLRNVLETYPRDELFQASEIELYDTAFGILRLKDRQRVRLFLRRDIYGRFYSCLVYVPRERYNTEVRIKIQEILKLALDGTSAEFIPFLSQSPMACILMQVYTPHLKNVAVNIPNIESKILEAIRHWEDDLQVLLIKKFGSIVANDIAEKYMPAFPAAYKEEVIPSLAIRDISVLTELSSANPQALRLYRPADSSENSLRFRVFQYERPISLSVSLRILERMGVKVEDERSYSIEINEHEAFHIHDFGLKHDITNLQVKNIKSLFEELFLKVLNNEVENDEFNRLVLHAELKAQEIVLLRAYCKYLKQACFTFSQSYIENTLSNYPLITQKLIELFKLRFAPSGSSQQALILKLEEEINASLDQVAILDDDRILRRFLSVINATLRTNFYQTDLEGRSKAYLSFKLNPHLIPELPEPRPMFEIFVYSPRVEGIHLRGGKVARGGLRWSDRMEDFRTEVLGLIKAQMVKNAVIVPVGSKGGFVVKTPPRNANRDELLKEGIYCYQTFLRGLLDITDNLIAGKIVPPTGVKRYDEDDPYLVVAADKGTAAFSDIANAVAAQYNFWLGDAFASGGSAGYDHKKMGITAKGAWESVKRHFRELSIDTQTTDFTVAGIGDMSGDVFGNGMLCSRHIRLVAAFDHRHIFIDPDPDAAVSFAERERLFNLPRSSWTDYDVEKISKGGGVFSRMAKSIAISPEIKLALAIVDDKLTPMALIKAILKAPVDLLYLGGIGTYVKSSKESNAEVGDKGNDDLRVNASELKCRVVAEGGNLGLTQRGRIEYALNGGAINTDAIDNSGGVDCSDHEVNIKILLDSLPVDKNLTIDQRNNLLSEMTHEVESLVLRDNYDQSEALSITQLNSARLLNEETMFMRHLEKQGRLNRAVEFLPTNEEINERRIKGQTLTRPESAVLLAYSKIALFDELLPSSLLNDDYITSALLAYFPKALQENYALEIKQHPLKREILATSISNTMTNRVGATFIHRIQEEMGASVPDVVRAYILVRDIFAIRELWKEIEALDNHVSAKAQLNIFSEIGRMMTNCTLWVLRRNKQEFSITKELETFKPRIDVLTHSLKELLPSDYAQDLENTERNLINEGIPSELAQQVSNLDSLYATLDIVDVAINENFDEALVAKIYFALVVQLDLRWIHGQIRLLPTDTNWQLLVRKALREDLLNQQRALTLSLLKSSPINSDSDVLLESWKERYSVSISRVKSILDDLKTVKKVEPAMLSVAMREVRLLLN